LTEAAGEPASARDEAETLRRAEALVFVEDLEAPEPDEDDRHHLAAVLRLGAGDEVVISDGRGGWRRCTVTVAPSQAPARTRPGRGRHEALGLAVAGPLRRSETPRPPITVGFAMQKGDRPEWTVQKLTELGVDVIVPFISERTVVRIDGPAARRRGERLRRVAREAASQSRRTVLPDVADPGPLRALPAELLVGSLLAEPGGGPLPPEVTAVLVGPEGGWSPGELALGKGLVGLGPGVLRAETAAVAAAVLLSARRSGVLG